MAESEIIEAYLDELAEALRVSPRRQRRILREVEDHLNESVRALVAAGTDAEMAAREAVARFGTPAQIARRFEGDLLASVQARLPGLVLTLGSVVGVGLVCIGLSGLIAGGLSLVWGQSFIAGDTNGVTYTAARCADFLSFHPEAADCASAATLHHFDEVFYQRMSVGVVGILDLVVVWLAARRFDRAGVPVWLEPSLGFAILGFVAFAFAGLSFGQVVFGSFTGTGQGIAIALAAALGALWYGRRLLPVVLVR